MGDHSEAIEVDFDPAVIGFEDLLDAFFAGHDPCRPSFKRQYRSAIFYANEEQRNAAARAIDSRSRECGGPAATALEPHTGFTRAEDYHQKYLLRRSPDVLAELVALYPEPDGFLASTAVTRANAFLGGNGSEQRLREDLPRMGLSAETVDRLSG